MISPGGWDTSYPYFRGVRLAILHWRLDRNHRHSPHALPDDVADGILQLMLALGLRFGAPDFGVCVDGKHVFFEVNPSGQWLFCEIETGANLSEALATALLNGRSVQTPELLPA